MGDNPPFLGQIALFGFNFAPLGWTQCQGQLLSIAQNDALFALIGTTYGGDGQNTFGVPDLRGRAPLHMGQGGGLSPYVIGQQSGTENVTLQSNQVPLHTHGVSCSSVMGNLQGPAGNVYAASSLAAPDTLYDPTPNGTMAATTIVAGGNALPHNNMQQSLALNYCIAVEGVFPSQN